MDGPTGFCPYIPASLGHPAAMQLLLLLQLLISTHTADSLVSRFNLICSDNWKVQLANSLYFIGCFLGSGLFGALSDHIGRKRPMLIATAILAVATLLNAAAPNCWFISVMRLVAGMGAAGQVQGILLLCMESTGRSARLVPTQKVTLQ
eukprot:GHUV01042936.1.p2 GENE.GHUV01042936.1~~GHUV01042936.1.p2  ORF type:complete len:149 (+),score=20.79 GHUV01042936.1:51-497(+)